MTATADSSIPVALTLDPAATETDCGQATAKHLAQQTPGAYTKLPHGRATTGVVDAETDCGQATAKHLAQQTPGAYTKLPHGRATTGVVDAETDCGQATAKHLAQQTPGAYTKLPHGRATTGVVDAETDCGQATAKDLAQQTPGAYTKLPHGRATIGLVPAEWMPTLGDWSALIAEADDDVDDYIAAHADTFLEPGGGWDGCEAPVQRAILIALRNGLRVASTVRVGGSIESDHHIDQSSAFAVDLSDSMEPTPGADRAARQIACALDVKEWDAGVPLVRERNGIRALLIWRTEAHHNHIHFGCRRVGPA